MTGEQLYEILGDINEEYVDEAGKTTRKREGVSYKMLGAIAACLGIFIMTAAIFYGHVISSKPNPEQVQLPNPLLEVDSLEEMEEYLDFKVPVLNKDVETYIVLVIDDYPKIGRIEYADGSTFNMEYGSEDVSGIYGGELDKQIVIDDIQVNFYRYIDDNQQEVNYAIWEKNGFSYSLTGGEELEEEVSYLIK